MTLTRRILAVIAMSGALFGASTAGAGHHEAGEQKAKPSIVEAAAGNPDFSTLVAALKAADLVEVLSGEGPFTVFAPTNEAFAQLPAGTLDMLLLPENKDKLTAILTYHVAAGKVMAADVVKVSEVESLQGDTIAVKVTEDGVMVDGAEVIATDAEASNGVIHVINAVIMPQQ